MRLRRLTVASTPPEALGHRGLMSMVGLVAQSATKFLTNWLSGRLGGPSLLGTVSLAMSTAQLLSLVGPTAVGAASSKFLARAVGEGDQELATASARYLVRLSALTLLPLGLSGAAIWLALGGSATGSVVIVFLVSGLSGYAVARGMFFGNRHIGPSGAWDVVTAAVGLAGTAGMMAAGVRDVVVLAPLAAAYLIYAWAGFPRGAKGRPPAPLRREIRTFVALNALGTIASAGFVQASLLAANSVGGREGAGHYSSAFTLAAPITIMVGAGSAVLYPSMAEALGRGDLRSFTRQTHQATKAISVLISGLIGLLIVLGDVVLRIIWGSSFAAAEPLLPVMLGAVFVNAIGVPSVNALTSRTTAHSTRTAAYAWVGAFVGALTWLAAAPSWGVTGVAVGYFVAATVTSALAVVYLWREDGHSWAGLLGRACAVLAVSAIAWFIPHRDGWSYPQRYLTAVGFLLVWGLLMKSELREVFTVLRSGRRARSTPASSSDGTPTDPQRGA